MNASVRLGVNIINALQALRLKRHRLNPVSEGVEIHQPGKPVLLLTAQAAEDFARQFEGAD